MKSDILFDYISDNSNIDKKILEYFRPEITTRLFGNGSPLRSDEKSIIKDLVKYLSLLLKHYFTLYNIRTGSNLKSCNNIISNAYFDIDIDLRNLGYNVYSCPWTFGRSSKSKILPDLFFYKKIKAIEKTISRTDLANLLDKLIISELGEFIDIMTQTYKKWNIKTFFCSSSYPFFNRISIDVLNDMDHPSFMLQHGIPGVYESHMKFYDGSYNLIVWGDKFKEKYVNLGLDPNTVFVAGHPYYKESIAKELRFDFSNILIITKSLPGARLSKEIKLGDQGTLLLYLYSIQNVLKKLGVKTVRIRPHPSENKSWYLKLIDRSFFRIDKDDLKTSLQQSTLVIGPVSTTFLEATFYGVNYLVYEPTVDGIRDLIDFPIVFPFDGSDKRIPVAFDEETLYYMLKSKEKADIAFWHDYIKTPFDISFVKKFI
jgi:hypothetical protein